MTKWVCKNETLEVWDLQVYKTDERGLPITYEDGSIKIFTVRPKSVRLFLEHLTDEDLFEVRNVGDLT